MDFSDPAYRETTHSETAKFHQRQLVDSSDPAYRETTHSETAKSHQRQLVDSSEGVKKLISRDIAQNFLRVFDLQSIFKTSPDDFGGPDTCRIQLIHTFSDPAYKKYGLETGTIQPTQA